MDRFTGRDLNRRRVMVKERLGFVSADVDGERRAFEGGVTTHHPRDAHRALAPTRLCPLIDRVRLTPDSPQITRVDLAAVVVVAQPIVVREPEQGEFADAVTVVTSCLPGVQVGLALYSRQCSEKRGDRVVRNRC